MSRLVTSDKNYMKRDDSSGSDTMLGPNVSRDGGSFYTRDYIVEHNLGYTPMFRAYYEPFGDGRIVECLGSNQLYVTDPPNDFTISPPSGDPGSPEAATFVNDSILLIRLAYFDNSKAAITYPIHWVIYRDYAL